MGYILAIDQGTTGTTSLLLNEKLNLLGKSSFEFEQHFPHPGWVEHNPKQILDSVKKSIKQLLLNTGVNAKDITAIGITNQRETIVPIQKSNSSYPRNAIVWQCRRSSELCEEFRKRDNITSILKKTGLVMDPYFSASKMHWMIKNDQAVRSLYEQDDLILGTIDSFLIHALSGGESWVTDASNASRTMLYNLHEMKWDDELLDFFGVKKSMLPDVLPNNALFGKTKGFDNLPDGIPIYGVAGDQQAALFGQLCTSAGEAKCTYGTGSFTLLNTGSNPIDATGTGLLTTVGWQINSEISYALEGSCFVAGSAVQWLRDGVKILENAAASEEMALGADPESEVFFVPALTGLGAPYWNAEARGAFFGLSRGVGRNEMVKATLEGVALQQQKLFASLAELNNGKLGKIRVDGGAAMNNFLMQFQADVTNVEIERPKVVETTALGAAMFAALGAGMVENLDQLHDLWICERSFKPEMDSEKREKWQNRWQNAIKALEIFHS